MVTKLCRRVAGLESSTTPNAAKRKATCTLRTSWGAGPLVQCSHTQGLWCYSGKVRDGVRGVNSNSQSDGVRKELAG